MMSVRLEPAAFRSRVKHSTTEPLPSHIIVFGNISRKFICFPEKIQHFSHVAEGMLEK